MNQVNKILVAISELLKNNKFTQYEDVVVKSFQMFPESFSLNRYEKYPDSNAVNKVIYTTLKPDGYIIINNLRIYLTDFGRERIRSIKKTKKGSANSNNLDDNIEKKEIKRILSLKGFKHFVNNREKEPIDIDCYEFYGITARTPTREMQNKKRQLELRLKNLSNSNNTIVESLLEYKYKIEIQFQLIINEHNTTKN